jgi:hypothetical protein
MRIPPITACVTEQSGWILTLFAEALGTSIYAMFYLNFIRNKLGGGDIVLSGLSLATVYYAMMWLTQQTSSGILNPAVGMAQGFTDQWNYFFTSDA